MVRYTPKRIILSELQAPSVTCGRKILIWRDVKYLFSRSSKIKIEN